MAFTGKATYSAGTTLPELAEDVSDLVGIISPYETLLLDAFGDPMREAKSTHHEWLEDELLPNKDAINDATFTDPAADTDFVVDNGSRFRVGDQIQVEGSEELMLVTGINSDTLTVIRGYAGTTSEDLADNQVINILGNAALEGAARPNARFTNRTRCSNYTQIFTATVEVSGTDIAASQLGLADEMDYQKQERLRELLRDLENTVINGGQPTSDPQGSGTVRRSMKGIIQHLSTNIFHTGDSGFPAGDSLDEAKINYVLRKIWEQSSGNVDLIVVGGFQKRKINAFSTDSRTYAAGDTTFTDMISVYESDFGVCRIITTRWMAQDAVLLLDSSRISVLPLSGRSFHFKSLASSGDYECGEVIGEYTLELKNEAAHGLIRDL
ncbi:MAG: SU10 major capsid protein, partial [Planctomycetota bacterium]